MQPEDQPRILVANRGHVRILTLNHPARRNALDLEDRVELIDRLRDAQERSRAIVITGSGSMFCAGGDISTMTQDRDIARRRLDLAAALTETIVNGRRPVIAAVEGGAFGLGLALASACDLVVASKSSSFSTAFAKLGLSSDTGLAYTLPLRIGRARTRELLLTARTVDCAEAHAMGMIDRIVDDGSALDNAVEVATRLAGYSAPMLSAVKQLMSQTDQSLAAILHAENDIQLNLMEGPEFSEGRSAFLERRRPDFINL